MPVASVVSGRALADTSGADGQGRAAGRLRWADLARRALSALVLGPAALLCLWYGGAAWTALIVVGAIAVALEWRAMCRLREATSAGVVAGGIGAVALGALALIWLRADALAGRGNVLFVVLTVWACDIGAYLVGRMAGGPRLAPRISPGKTWSGAAGGLIAAMLAGWLAAGAPVSLAPPLVAGLLALAAQAGDLFESAAKRHFGVKDSGWLIPGHGGVLDRVDGILAAAPAAALIALAVGRGGYLWR